MAVLRMGLSTGVGTGLFFRGDVGRWTTPTTVAEEPKGGRPPGAKRGPEDKAELGLETENVDLGSRLGAPFA